MKIVNNKTYIIEKVASFILIFIFLSIRVQAQNYHYIRSGANGSGTGNDWDNAFTSIPAVLIRGDTYYICAGSYGPYTFSPLSGTNYVYLKTATVLNHGTNMGWTNSYAVGEALFSGSGAIWTINTDYIDVDGGYGSGTNQHGIHISSSLTTPGGAVVVPYGVVPAQSHIWFRSMEINVAPWGNGNNARIIYHDSSTTTDWNFTNCFFHGGYCGVSFIAGGSAYNLIDHCTFYNIGSDVAANHCAFVTAASANYTTIRNCIFWNAQGNYNTTYIEPQFQGSHFYVYGNVFREDSGVVGTGQGIFAITSSDVWTDVHIYNNTGYGLHTTAGLIWAGNVTGQQVFVTNNLFQSCLGSLTIYNPGSSLFSGNNIVNTPLVQFKNSSVGDFHLTQAVPGIALESSYDIDPDGNIRGADGAWDIGAYEFVSASNNLAPPWPPFPSFKTTP